MSIMSRKDAGFGAEMKTNKRTLAVKRLAWFATLATAMMLSCCVHLAVDDTPVEKVREASREPEPACFLQFYECDQSGANCQLVRTEYQDADGTKHTWESCNLEYEAWLRRLDKARALLRKKDPQPRCLKLDASVAEAMGADPKDPDALLNLAEHGTMMGSRKCTAEWCAWMQRNSGPGRALPKTCTPQDQDP